MNEKIQGIKKRRMSSGEFVFVEGDHSFQAYIINSGTIEIYKGNRANRRVLGTMTEGQMFGEMGIISDSPRSASAYCITDCEFTVIDREVLERKIKEADPYIRFLIDFLIERVKSLS